MFAVFFTSLPTATAVGYTSPFEALRNGFATGDRTQVFPRYDFESMCLIAINEN